MSTRCPKCGSNDHMDCYPEVAPLDMWTLLISTVRYSFGRMSVMPDEAPRLVLRYQEYLNLHQLKQIAREINEELERHERWASQKEEGDEKRLGGPMGQACDVRTWVEGRDAILAVVLRREAAGEKDY